MHCSHFAQTLLPLAGFGRTRMKESPSNNLDADDHDDTLMARFCAGDEQAFALLYDRYAPQLEIFLRRFVRDRSLAEDLLQTTFLSFVRARGRYLPSAGLRGWLYAIAANASRDALRRRGVRREEILDENALSGEQSDATAELSTSGELSMRDPNVARAVEEALQKLPADQREAVMLHKLHGLSFPEVATALGTSVGAAKVRAHRGYQRLRILLAAWENA